MLHCVTHWPFCPGVFIAFLGVLAAFMTFWEHPPRLVKAICTGIFFTLMWGEIWMMSKDRDAHDAEQKEARTLAQQELANINYLTLQGMRVSDVLSELNRKMDKAGGNSKLLYSLNMQAKAAQAQFDAISKQLLAVAASKATSTIVPVEMPNQYDSLPDDQLRSVAKKTADNITEKMQAWKWQLGQVDLQYNEQVYHKGHQNDDQRQKWEDYRTERSKRVNDDMSKEIAGLLSQASDIRKALIKRMHGRGIAVDDRSMDALFSELTNSGVRDGLDTRPKQAADYLLGLVSQLR